MAGKIRNAPARLIDELHSEPRAFRFIQAVRLLEAAGMRATGKAVGMDHLPAEECVRFKSSPSLTFPGTEVHSLRLSQEYESHQGPGLKLSFMGMVGAAGVLPQHYTSLIIERKQLKDTNLRDLIDIFQHRTIALFYRSWLKYRFPLEAERELRNDSGEGDVTQAIYSLIGLGLPSQRNRGAMEDEAYALEAGHFARSVRTPGGLERGLQDHFGIAARIEEFVGQWLEIPEEERTALPRTLAYGDHRVCLGGGATLGSKVWDVGSAIRVHLGPLGYERYLALSPGGREYQALCAFVEHYVGFEMDFGIQLDLLAGESPGTSLASTGNQGLSQLGRNTWLEVGSSSSSPRVARFPGRQHSAND